MDFHNRQYDPQLGRFLSIDPMADDGGQQVLSPYHAMSCNPVTTVDPLGLKGLQVMSVGMQIMTPQEIAYWSGGNHAFDQFLTDLDNGMLAHDLFYEALSGASTGSEAQEEFATLVAYFTIEEQLNSEGKILAADLNEMLSGKGKANYINGENDNTSLIQILIWDVESENSKADLGHVALQINGIVYGFYPSVNGNIYNSKGRLKVHRTRKEFISEYHDDKLTVL